MIPYGKQQIDDSDIEAVVSVLRSDYLTTGPIVAEFEQAFAEQVHSKHAVAVSSGTAALHAALATLRVGPGDEVIVPPMTFAATANSVTYFGATPVFADVFPDTLLIDPADVAAKITPHTRAVIAVDYAGQLADYSQLADICQLHGVYLIADCCHSLGASQQGAPAGSLADLSCFSFHPVKSITAGEGGMVTTNIDEWDAHLRRFRNHGIDADFRQRAAQGKWRYDVVDEGYNYRLSDIHSALGLSQLKKLDGWTLRRRQIAERYRQAFAGSECCECMAQENADEHAYHLFVIRWLDSNLLSRDEAFTELRNQGIGVNVHYWPVHLNSYYLDQFGTDWGMCPEAESAAQQILSLPIFPGLLDSQVDQVVEAVHRVGHRSKKSA